MLLKCYLYGIIRRKNNKNMNPQIQNIANNQNTNAEMIPYMPPPLINEQGYFNELSDLNSVDIVQKLHI